MDKATMVQQDLVGQAMLALGMLTGIALERGPRCDAKLLESLDHMPDENEMRVTLAAFEAARDERGEQRDFYIQALRDLVAFKASRDAVAFRASIEANFALNGAGRVRVRTTSFGVDAAGHVHVVTDDGSMPAEAAGGL